MHGMIGLVLELVDDLLGERRGDREADPDRAAGGRIDRCVDADDLAVHVEHWTAGIAAVDRRVGLQKIVIGARIDVALTRRQDARGDAAAEPERVADRQHPVADARRVAVAPIRRGQRLVGLDLEQGDVGLGVAADHRGLQIGVVVQDDGDLVGIGDDVVIGDDIARRIDDEAGAERGRLARRHLRMVALGQAVLEEVVKELLKWRARRKLRHVGPGLVAAGSPEVFRVCVVEMLTTEGNSRAARSAKLSGAAASHGRPGRDDRRDGEQERSDRGGGSAAYQGRGRHGTGTISSLDGPRSRVSNDHPGRGSALNPVASLREKRPASQMVYRRRAGSAGDRLPRLPRLRSGARRIASVGRASGGSDRRR